MLDPDQRDAAFSDPHRPLLVLAHAGTGKTRTLVERLQVLRQARDTGVFGDRGAGAIAALTFTRAATRELRDRLAGRRGDDGLDGYDVRTFHALGLALYRDGWARDYDNRPHVRIATRAQAQHAATEAARAVGLDLAPHRAVRLIADAKLGLPIRMADAVLTRAALAVHDDLLAQRDLTHVDDLLVRPVHLLSVRLASDLDEDGLVAQAEMDGLLKELARSLVDGESEAANESAEEILAHARADELADTELIVDARDIGMKCATADDELADGAGLEPAMAMADPPSHPDLVDALEPLAIQATTVSLFDYIATHPATRHRGKRTRHAPPSAQLLLFDLFEERPVAEPTPIPSDAECQQVELFATAS